MYRVWKHCPSIIGIVCFAVDSKQIVKGGKEERKIYLKDEKKTAGGKEKEEKKGTAKLTGKDKEVCSRVHHGN